jgi:hypothetical protein
MRCRKVAHVAQKPYDFLLAFQLGEMLMPKHIWTEKDDLMILFVHKFGIESSPLTKQQIADKIGVTVSSLTWRIGNFKAIDGKGKATNFAKLSEEIYKKYSNLVNAELRQQAFGSV